MKRITAFVGSARRGHTYRAVVQFMASLEAYGDVEYEIVSLGDYHLDRCLGCKRCFDKGEQACPLKDDRDLLIARIDASDGIVFASPNYSFQVSGLMKCFLDRFGFFFHRPRFFGKVFTNIVVQGIYGGGKIVRYLDFVGNGLGFNTVGGSCLRAIDPLTEEAEARLVRNLDDQSRRFWRRMAGPSFPTPGLLKLMHFRLSRTSIRLRRNRESRDFKYYQERGWLESDYFYAVRLGVLKRAAGRLFDLIGAKAAKVDEKAVIRR